MPTGYTSKVLEGATFNEFVWGCARAFGALLDLKEEPLAFTLPEKFKPSPHHLEAATRAKEDLDKFFLLSNAEQFNVLEARHVYSQEQEDKGDEERVVEDQKYAEMSKRVEAWEPPTVDHEALKAFMLKQLKISRHRPTLRERPEVDYQLEVEKHRSQLIRNLRYHEEHYVEEVTKVLERNQWVEDLHHSLNLED